jgi:hypothetical protein
MMTEKGKRAAYTLEFKLEAVRLVQSGQAKAVTAKILGVPVHFGGLNQKFLSKSPQDRAKRAIRVKM